MMRSKRRFLFGTALIAAIGVISGWGHHVGWFQEPLPRRPVADQCVILVHGLARSGASMSKLEKSLSHVGYQVQNITYPSTKESLQALASTNLQPAVDACRGRGAKTIHFVTHSMGGILVRLFVKENRPPELGRVVMLAPPNQGSEVVDVLVELSLFKAINGPAGAELGTGPQSTPLALGPADFPLGIITGNSSWSPILSTIIPGEDDGKVAVARAKLQGMDDFLVLPVSHTFIMDDDTVIAQAAFFLGHGRFER